MELAEIQRDFSLFKRIVSPTGGVTSSVDISALEKLISDELPQKLEDNAPPYFPSLYFDFRQEFERFKEFILFDRLIGKNVVALGGGFSTGKSSFINSILENPILPQDIAPSTSVPTYIVNGEDVFAYGINSFDSRVDMELGDVKAISHGFGKMTPDDSEATLGHILKSIFISSPAQRFSNIALLDTPGYSKAESKEYSAKTDENIARAQLNSANFILWFIQASAGTITDSDINFLKTLASDIPKLIIVNKAEQCLPEELKNIIEKVKSTLDTKGISYVDVLAYSCRKKKDSFDREKILAQLERWNENICENRFAYNFKILFTKCKEYYDERIDEEKRSLSRLNTALTLSENDTITECLNSLLAEIKQRERDLSEHLNSLIKLREEFFSEIKRIGDEVHINMPEPSEIDLVQGNAADHKLLIEQYIEKKGIKYSYAYFDEIKNALSGSNNNFREILETEKPAKELSKIILAGIGKGD